MTRAIELHLVYASILWLAAWLLTMVPRGSASAKYWIWVATSVNFVLPLSVLPARWWPSQAGWFVAPLGIEGVSWNLAGVWLSGAAVMFARLLFRIRADDSTDGPSVVGLIRPRIHLPAAIDRVLTRDEVEAVLIHERHHAIRRDNLIRLLHELSLCLLWFHPMVWMTRARLGLFRELSCDEAVIRRGRGEALVAALAKLAHSDPGLLHAGASSFVGDRLGYLTRENDPGRAATILIAVAFSTVLLLAVVSPIAQAVAAYACALTHGLVR